MPKITFIDAGGQGRELEYDAGETLMEVARDNDVEGIDADCGGACACATCHVYVEAPWADKLPAKDEMESDMLDFTEAPALDTSRLSCQIELSEAHDGMVVKVPVV